LILDDEVSICLLLENFLSKKYEVVIINRCSWLNNNIPDLMCDIQMETMVG
jgi:two-component SAPR family response regulator